MKWHGLALLIFVGSALLCECVEKSGEAIMEDVASARELILKKDYSAAAARLAAPVAARNADALMLQGVLHATGAGACYDYPLALEFWRQAAFAGNRDAARLLLPSLNGQYAREWWSERIAGMRAVSAEAPPDMVSLERGGLIVNRERAKKWISSEAEAGSAVGLYNAYQAAIFGARDNDAAKARVRRLLERAAELKLPIAMRELSSELEQSFPVSLPMSMGFVKDVKRAGELMHAAAELGDPSAQLLWGHWLSSTKKGFNDLTGAAEHYRRASEQGNGYASYFLYEAYAEGKGVDRNEAKALEYLSLAAQRGNDTAVSIYGNRLFRGEGMKADQSAAVAMLENSLVCSLTPDEDALALVAYAYASGWGAKRSERQALWWAKWAAERGSTYGAELVAKLSTPENSSQLPSSQR